jgi:hypothetical protein
MDYDDRMRLKIYGTNFLTPSAIGLLRNTPLLKNLTTLPGVDYISGAAHPYAALFYGGLDALGRVSSRIKNSLFTRVAHAGGAGVFGLASVLDVFSIAGGDFGSIINLGFDASMAYQLGKDTLEDYSRGEDLVEDLDGVRNRVRGLFGKADKVYDEDLFLDEETPEDYEILDAGRQEIRDFIRPEEEVRRSLINRLKS